MSYTSGFFDAADQGEGNYDRVYNAETFAHYFGLLVKNGVFPNPSTCLQVRAATVPNMTVIVQPGSGWINGYYITVPDDGPEVLTIPTANASLSRIDSVIMGLNTGEREIQLYIKSGAVSFNPSPVTLQQDSDLYELELAQIRVSAGMASIPQASITDMRQNANRCGIVKGTIEEIDATDLFIQYDDAFQTWFNGIKDSLSGDVAANLKLQIDALDHSKAPNNHASETTTYGVGSDIRYGHVKLSSSLSDNSDVSGGVAATPKAIKALQDAKAPKKHAAFSGDYGEGGLGIYGHVKLDDSVTNKLQTANVGGVAATPSAVAKAYDWANTAVVTLLGSKKIVCGWSNVKYVKSAMTRTVIPFGVEFQRKPVVIIGQPFNGVVCTADESRVTTTGFTVSVPGVGDSDSEQTRLVSWVAIGDYLTAVG